MWLAQTLRVLSRRMTSLILPEDLCFRRRTSPVPRSFHSSSSLLNRNSLARLRIRLARGLMKIIVSRDKCAGHVETRGYSRGHQTRYSHLEKGLLILLVCLCLDLLGQLDDRLEMRVMLLLVLPCQQSQHTLQEAPSRW